MYSLYEKLKNCASREEVRAACLAAFGLSFPAKQKSDSTEQVLYIFRKERKFAFPKGVASPLAQALYILRELKYGEATCPVPPYVCAVCRGEAFFAETKPFARFYARKTTECYDWDRTPLSPCPVLTADIAEAISQSRIRVYSLKEAGEEEAFFAALARVRAVQLSMFKREKKTIDEDNFLSVYAYWSSMFSDILGESKEAGKIAEYFLADIETGRTLGKDGRVEFTIGDKKVVKSLPVYEYTYFWSVYERVKDEKIIFAIRRKIDRLSEDFARRFEGEFYTPIPFAAKAYEYIAKTVGKERLSDGSYRIWDMAAGSGNLEFTLPASALKYTYISTLGSGDVDYCKRIFPAAEVFQYDYLSDDVAALFSDRDAENKQCSIYDEENFSPSQQLSQSKQSSENIYSKLPEKLKKDLKNPALKWLIFINPPFATSNESAFSAGKQSKKGVSDTEIRREMIKRGYGATGRELFSQFLFRIAQEFKGKKGYLGLFSTLKYLNAPNDKKLRDGFFRYTAERGFIFSSENFEGSKGKFPVCFAVWNMEKQADLSAQRLCFDVYNRDAEKVGVKRLPKGENAVLLSEWVKRPPTKYVFPAFTGAVNVCRGNADVRDRIAEGFICSLMCCGNDFQHLNQTALFSGPQASAGSYSVTADNFDRSMAVHAVRRLVKPSWENNRDQFYAPAVEPIQTFYDDCTVWSLFAESNNTCSMQSVLYKDKFYRVRNGLFPFSYLDSRQWSNGRLNGEQEGESFAFGRLSDRIFSAEAGRVLSAAREFYAYCFSQGKADVWDAGFMQLKSAISADEGGRALLGALKSAHKALGEKLLPEVYKRGFAPPTTEYFEEGE